MPDFEMNRLANCRNEFQGPEKRVLCVCSAGLLRSPTTAWVLSQAPYFYNTRAAGLVNEFALIPVDRVLTTWADEIVCMEQSQVQQLMSKFDVPVSKIICLNISDSFARMNPALIMMIRESYAIESAAKSQKIDTGRKG